MSLKKIKFKEFVQTWFELFGDFTKCNTHGDIEISLFFVLSRLILFHLKFKPNCAWCTTIIADLRNNVYKEERTMVEIVVTVYKCTKKDNTKVTS